MARTVALLDRPRADGSYWFRGGAVQAGDRRSETRGEPAGGRRYPSTPDGRGIAVSMIPEETDDDRLRNVLLAAKRAHDFGRGNADDRLAQVEPLIKALDKARQQRHGYKRLVHELLATVREIPIMPVDPMMGSEPLVYRWVVAKPADFDKVVMKLRAEFPESL